MSASERSERKRDTTNSLGAEKLTPAEQRRRFIEAAREAGCSEDEAVFDAALKKIVRAKAEPIKAAKSSKPSETG